MKQRRPDKTALRLAERIATFDRLDVREKSRRRRPGSHNPHASR